MYELCVDVILFLFDLLVSGCVEQCVEGVYFGLQWVCEKEWIWVVGIECLVVDIGIGQQCVIVFGCGCLVDIGIVYQLLCDVFGIGVVYFGQCVCDQQF